MTAARATEFLDIVTKSGYEYVAAFSHAGMLRRIMECALGTQLPEGSLQCPNCTLMILERRENKWRLNCWLNPRELGL